MRYDELVSPPCHPGAATRSALASLDTDIDAVLPPSRPGHCPGLEQPAFHPNRSSLLRMMEPAGS